MDYKGIQDCTQHLFGADAHVQLLLAKLLQCIQIHRANKQGTHAGAQSSQIAPRARADYTIIQLA